ncbi:MAG TPA: sigma-54 dependent transcriptional regulator [Candidatus Limnocylindrales bacterium]|nr:sigma-54 dependent transcriptional regulator [Candidatus Limnocylindrales bacterium]
MAEAHAGRLTNHNLENRAGYLEPGQQLRAASGSPPLNLLVVDDDEHIREVCRAVAAECGMKSMDVGTAEEALEVLELSSVDIVLTDLRLPGTSGLELLKKVAVTHPDVAVVMLTQYGTIDSAVEATRMGAADYVTKPFRVEELRARLDHVVHAVELKRENRLLREQVRSRPGFGGLIGMSPRMDRVYKMIEKVSQRDHPVLILGESGTGKELVARSIHYLGPRKDKPFVPVECSALVSTLVESELFGYTKGAFTGALQAKQGLIESANGGTLFLDEIGEMSLEMQAKLLRALQQREIKPVGSTERKSINVRILAATNRDLELAIKSGAFRQDLYFRLNVVQIKLPPLRERKSDIPLLVTSFLEKFSGDSDTVREMTEDAMRRLMAYDWPGNVRELENAIERAVALGTGPFVSVTDLPSNLQYPTSDRAPAKEEMLPLEELERRAILSTLRQTGGDKQAAARALGIGKTTLYRKLKQYQIEHADA